MGKVETTKKKRRVNRRLKRQVRRTIAAIFMITAIVVAALPVDELQADAPVTTASAAETILPSSSTPYTYPDESTLTGKYIVPTDDTKPAGTNTVVLNSTAGINASSDNTGTTYYMVYDATENAYQMQWRYKYYIVDIGGNNKGIIYEYNKLDSVNELIISSKANTNYITVSDTDYLNFREERKVNNPVDITYAFNMLMTPNDASRFISKYFPSVWSQYVSNCNAYIEDQKKGGNSIARPENLTVSTSALQDDDFLRYYCDEHSAVFSEITEKLTGCELVAVYDLTQNQENGQYPRVYVPRVPETGDFNTKVNYDPDTRFVYSGTVSLAGIANNTFKNVENITNYTIGDQIYYIGDNAFEGTSIRSITFSNDVRYIGNQAFKNCYNLSEVIFGTNEYKIGVEAFSGTAIQHLEFPISTKEIGMCAFSNCTSLQEVDFSKIQTTECIIEEGAFYNDYSINTLKFAEGNRSAKITAIGDGCFAVDPNRTVSSSLTTIALPEFITQSEKLGNKMFYGRNNLSKIVMPADFGADTDVVIRDDFLAGVKNLKELEFLESSARVTYTYKNDGSSVNTPTPSDTTKSYALFRDITNPDFVVRGPARKDRNTSDISDVRKTTWNAYYNNYAKTPIPFVFEDQETGADIYEVATGEKNAFIMSINQAGELYNCMQNTESEGYIEGNPIDLNIPAKVGAYSVSSIKSGCFDGMKDIIKTINIDDNSVEILQADVFKDCSELVKVTLGNSISQIGANSFYNCPKLTDVYFRTPLCGYETFEIGTNAFQTLGKKLTFHGDIIDGYAAYEYAMAPDNWVDNSNSSKFISICYKSDYVKNDKPGFLTVLKERYESADGTIATRATLVDYLHYEELAALSPNYLLDAFGVSNDWSAIMADYENGNGVTPKEEEIINAAIHINIPSGIDSIDVKAFLENNLNSGNVSTYLHNSLGYTDDIARDDYYENYAYASKVKNPETRKQTHTLTLDQNSSFVVPAGSSSNMSGVFEEGEVITVTPKKDVISSSDFRFDTFGTDPNTVDNFITGWEPYGWAIKCSDSNFASSLGNNVYYRISGTEKNLSFNMPLADVALTTICSPYILMNREELNNLRGTENKSVSISCTELPISLGYKIPYYFDYWTMVIYQNNGTTDIDVTDRNDVERFVEGFDAASHNLTLTIKPGCFVHLTAHYGTNLSNLNLSAMGQKNITNISATGKKIEGNIYPDYYYNYLTYGLFNGYFGNENSNDAFVYSGREYASTGPNAGLELVDIGNDVIQSVTMSSVKYIPDYAFNSCEQLTKINLGNAIESIGSAAFTGCDKLTSLSSSGKYVSQNGILYYTEDEGQTYRIVECLTSRGNGVGSSNYPDADDIPLEQIYGMNAGAFEGCKALSNVDLSDATNLTTIPENAFKDCASLQKVLLPRTITTIETGAFVNTRDVYVTIPNMVLEIQDHAFSSGETIRSFANGSGYYYTQKFSDVFFEAIDVTYKVDFIDWDGTALCDPQYVEPGKNATPPEAPTREGYTFAGWSGTYIGVDKDSLVIATYTLNQASPAATYKLDVDMGNGDGSYTAGTKVVITAYDPFDGYEFDKWTSDSSDFNIVDSSAYLTTITMPAHDLMIKATYKAKKTSGTGSENNNSAGNNIGNGTTSGNNNGTVSNNNRPNNSTNNSGNSGSNSGSSNSGTKVEIDKEGISNGGVSSGTANGTTDNFIVKITDSTAATEAVRQALIHEYGSLENIAFMAMDISLYDSTGTTKITDTNGISITITIPIPDSLVQYAGNNKAAGVVDSLNGYALDKLGTKFSTIDGVSCVTFTATHFSPYTIYVDKGNLSYSEKLDDSPQTGDGIHPKWFLSVGLASLSILLFFKKDKKVRKVRVA